MVGEKLHDEDLFITISVGEKTHTHTHGFIISAHIYFNIVIYYSHAGIY